MLKVLGLLTESIQFLDMEYEILQVFLCWCGAAVLGLWAFGKVEDREFKPAVGTAVIFWIQFGAALVLILLSILPAIALFFLFQWGPLLLCLIYAGLLGTGAYFLSRYLARRKRRRKYYKNPIFREALDYCRNHEVVAVQCFRNRVGFFTDIPNVAYCQRHHDEIKSVNYNSSLRNQKEWVRPAAWTATDSPECYIGTIAFEQQGYEDLPDLEIFAEALCKKLPGFDMAEHYQAVSYTTESYADVTKTITNHITVIYHDFFLFSKKRRDQLKKVQEKDKATVEEYRFQAPKKKNWE